MSTNHLSIKDSKTTLPDGGVTFLEISFTAPGHDEGSRRFYSIKCTQAWSPSNSKSISMAR
jgi:hypothetical protein